MNWVASYGNGRVVFAQVRTEIRLGAACRNRTDDIFIPDPQPRPAVSTPDSAAMSIFARPLRSDTDR